jgi:addiction module RelE/StbE family toxin
VQENKYEVFLLPRAVKDLDEIYDYIVTAFGTTVTADSLLDYLETAILSLAHFPERGSERKVGRFAHQGYRQLFVNNYTIVYRVEIESKRVIIYTIRYAHSNF